MIKLLRNSCNLFESPFQFLGKILTTLEFLSLLQHDKTIIFNKDYIMQLVRIQAIRTTSIPDTYTVTRQLITQTHFQMMGGRILAPQTLLNKK